MPKSSSWLRTAAQAFVVLASISTATADDPDDCTSTTPGWIANDGGRTAAGYFGALKSPRNFTDARPRTIGSSKCGCLAGGLQLPTESSDAQAGFWQVVQPQLNRQWGHPSLVAYLRDLARAARRQNLAGLLIGDMSQPAGGPMTSGHASHQLGLDADIWFSPMPPRRLTDAEHRTPFRSRLLHSMLTPKGRPEQVDTNALTLSRIKLLKTAALDPRVRAIFVHPLIKRYLCDRYAPGARPSWLKILRPELGHDAHFHVRLKCPSANAGAACRQPANEFGLDCDEGLDKKVRALANSGRDGDIPASEIRRSIRLFPPACQRLIGFSP
jgi:penicillin-insensitive murein endopeptidase